MTTNEFNALPQGIRARARIQSAPPAASVTAPRTRRTFKRFIDAQVVSEANRSQHWSKKQGRKKSQQLAVARAFGFELSGVGKPKRVKLVLLTEKPLDSDNLRSALKAERDQVAKMCGFDDREDVWAYDQRPRFSYESRGCWIEVRL